MGGEVKAAFADFRKDEMPTWAAGLTYYAVLSLFPALIVGVALLGVLGSYPQTSDAVLRIVGEIGPQSAVDTLRGTIEGVVKNSGGAGALLGIGLVISIWSASGYINAFFKAANAIWEVKETRPMTKLIPLRLALTVVFLVVSVLAAVAFVATGTVARKTFDVIGLGQTAVDVWSYAKFPVLALVVIALIALLYWAAPNVKEPKFHILSFGAAVGLIAVLASSALFGLYVANFGSYNKTYGTLAFVPLFLTWLWIINMALLFGAEVDAQIEKRRMADEGMGSAEPMAENQEQTEEEIDKIMEEVEENPPEKLEDWPGGKAKYRTIGGSGDANEDWEDGPTAKLGPSDVVHHPDGSVSVKGEKVDNPEDFKGDPIPGGPTDPDAPKDPAAIEDKDD